MNVTESETPRPKARQTERQPRGEAKAAEDAELAPSEAQRAAARVLASPGFAQVMRTLPALAQQVKMAPLLAQHAKETQAFFGGLSRPHRERAERAERVLAEKAKVDDDRRRAGGRKRAGKLKVKAAKNSDPIVAEWRAYEKQGRPDRHLWAGRIAEKFDKPRRTVDRYLKQAGCRK